jgi:hypothetical protein
MGDRWKRMKEARREGGREGGRRKEGRKGGKNSTFFALLPGDRRMPFLCPFLPPCLPRFLPPDRSQRIGSGTLPMGRGEEASLCGRQRLLNVMHT